MREMTDMSWLWVDDGWFAQVSGAGAF